MKKGWLFYDERDYEQNRLFAAHMRQKAELLELSLSVVFTEDFKNAVSAPLDFVISRQRNPLLSQRLERMGIPVFNNARVCELCNDKRNTHRFLKGLPLMRTVCLEPGETYAPDVETFPLVIKPAFGHGGDRVALAADQAQLNGALAAIYPTPALAQEVANDAGRDLRVYVLFGEITAAVMRTAQSGIVSNFKRGGSVSLHTLTDAETEVAEKVIRRFADGSAPLSFAGIDLIYHNGHPVINEIEDVVGSRMLYQVSDLDIIELYIRGIAARLTHDNSANL
ncbi:MAG: ATP-grasp domain-containing protein [Bacillota bacterium]